MLESSSLLGFSLVAFGMVLTPGPNMMYLVSRSICQGRKAGLISLGGVALAFVIYMLAAAFGITCQRTLAENGRDCNGSLSKALHNGPEPSSTKSESGHSPHR